MNITKHCKLRQTQRHISDSMIQLALQYGEKTKYSDKVILKSQHIDDIYHHLFKLIKQLESN